MIARFVLPKQLRQPWAVSSRLFAGGSARCMSLAGGRQLPAVARGSESRVTRIVSLPMYDQAPDALWTFWAGLRGHMRDAGLDAVPDDLSFPADLHAHWRSPDLLLSQTCGYPLATALRDQVRLVGTPRYVAPGCRNSDYASFLVVRHKDAARTVAALRDRRAAINDRRSQSGYNAFRALVAPHAQEGRFFAEVIQSGGHVRSLQMIQEQVVDVAAIDCVTYAMIARSAPPSIRDLRILCVSEPCPGLPLITARTTDDGDIARLRSAFAAACVDAALALAREALLLDGLEVRSLADYDRCLAMEASARHLGYPDIA